MGENAKVSRLRQMKWPEEEIWRLANDSIGFIIRCMQIRGRECEFMCSRVRLPEKTNLGFSILSNFSVVRYHLPVRPQLLEIPFSALVCICKMLGFENAEPRSRTFPFLVVSFQTPHSGSRHAIREGLLP
jgi:hypothetical protein